MSDGADKKDSGKPQLSLIPREAMEEMAAGFTYGANKYARYNFENGFKWSRPLDAALRHLFAMASGEFTDSESGNSHLAHALCSLAILAHTIKHYPESDDISRNKASK